MLLHCKTNNSSETIHLSENKRFVRALLKKLALRIALD